MKPGESPWNEVPDDWLDVRYGNNPEIARLQRFLGKKIKAEVIRKHLLAEGIGKPGELEISDIRVDCEISSCTIVVDFKVTGTAWKRKDKTTGLFVENNEECKILSDRIDMTRIVKKDRKGTIQSATFVSIGVGTARLPSDFGDEYFRRVIPFLQKIGVKSIDTMAATEANNPNSEKGRLIGAYAWSRYGYTNQDMDGTRREFLKYLREDSKIGLNKEEASVIRAWDRMIDMARYRIYRNGRWRQVGKDFLLGDDGTGRYSRDVIWYGVIPDINDPNSDEMTELRNCLSNPSKE